jgi:hypothetical protein
LASFIYWIQAVIWSSLSKLRRDTSTFGEIFPGVLFWLGAFF